MALSDGVHFRPGLLLIQVTDEQRLGAAGG